MGTEWWTERWTERDWRPGLAVRENQGSRRNDRSPHKKSLGLRWEHFSDNDLGVDPIDLQSE